MKKTKNISGFTILEMSVVLAIVSVIIGSILNVATSGIEEEKIKITKARMEFIMTTLKQYLNRLTISVDKQIPCPAGGDEPVDGAQFGIGVGTGIGGPDFCTQADFTVAATNLATGVVPTATLGIEPLYMLDGWQRKITYIVDQDLTYAVGGYDTQIGDIEVEDEFDNSVIGEGPGGAEPAAVIIISHGRNGHGAWRLKGSPPTQINLSAPGPLEIDNTPSGTMDSTFRMLPERTQGGYFDDIVIFQTQWQLEKQDAVP